MKTQTITAPKPKPLSFGQRERLRLRRDFEPLSEFLEVEWVATSFLHMCFPMPPNKANGRGAWRVDYNLKELFFAQCDELRARRVLPPPPSTPMPRAIIRAELVLKRTMDHDNAMARTKNINDWLVRRGYLVDDKPAHLSWYGVPTQRKATGTIQRVEIEVWEIK